MLMTEEQIKHMVGRFLSWRLPENFRPDAGISFKAAFNEHTAHPMKHEPTGTNLFDATQAAAMVRNMVEGLTADISDAEINTAFSGYGLALRREDEPPIPGEPLMSMADAKRVTRELLNAHATGGPDGR